MPNDITVEGVSGASGRKYFIISDGLQNACLPSTDFVGSARGMADKLAQKGIEIYGSKNVNALIANLDRVRNFPPSNVIEKVGWNGPNFALPDGTVIGNQSSILAFEANEQKCGRSGNLKKWKSKVAVPLTGHSLGSFILMSAFMPPLLDLTERVGNFGFEIVGKKGIGKSTLQYLMSSVLGGVLQGDGGHYWINLDTTINALEDVMKGHCDLPIIMDEANLLAADAPPKLRADIVKALAFKLGSGSEKGRLGNSTPRDYRLGFVISTNEPISSLIGHNSEQARAAADRLITIPIDDAKPFGVFDFLPESYSSSGDFAQALVSAAGKHHGWAINEFITHLVKERSNDEKKLRKAIKKQVARFRIKAGINSNDGSAIRVADAFGLVYAAGILAQKYGVLPKSLRCGPAALDCYKLHIQQRVGAHQPFKKRLAKLAKDTDVLRFTKKHETRKLKVNQHKAILRKNKNQLELLVMRSKIEQVFPDWQSIKSSREITRMMKRDGKHSTVKRIVAKGAKPVRVYCFKILPDN